MGEAIVSGSVTPDNYVVDKRDFSLVDSYIAAQEKALYRKAEGNGIAWSDLPSEKQEVQKLQKAFLHFLQFVHEGLIPLRT